MRPTISLLIMAWGLWAIPLSAQDCLPSITVYDELSVTLQPSAVIHATDFVQLGYSPCGNGPLTYRMRKSGTGVGVPIEGAVTATFNCPDMGYQPVEIWGGDAQGNWSYTESFVHVQDNIGNCGQGFSAVYSSTCDDDELPPALILFGGQVASLLSDNDGNASVKVNPGNLVLSKSDNCPGPIRLRIRKLGEGFGVPSTRSVSFGCDELGQQVVEVWAGDVSGNWSYTTTSIFVSDPYNVCQDPIPGGCTPDLMPPNILVYTGLAVNLGSNLHASVRAKPFIRQRNDNCSDNLTIRIGRDDGSTTPPSTVALSFGCNELGMQPVVIWVGDQAGNWSQTHTFINVQSNQVSCNPDPAAPEDVSARNVANGLMAGEFILYPNPTNGAFTLSGYLEQADFVQAELYNALGQQVRTLATRQWQEAGDVQFDFELGDLPGGLYRCALRTSTGVQSVSLIKN